VITENLTWHCQSRYRDDAPITDFREKNLQAYQPARENAD
jgi:hypothetical protein